MKILIVSSYFGPVLGGALNFIKELSIELKSRNHKVTLLLDERYKDLFSEDTFDIIWFSSLKITAYSPSLSFLKSILQIDADVIHLHGYMSFQTDFGALIAHFRKIPVVLSPHGSLLGYDHLYDSFLNKIPYYVHNFLTMKLPTKLPKFVIATSNAEIKDCKNFGVSFKKLKKIPLSFSHSSLIQVDKKSKIKIKLLFVGRLVPLKNLDVLLESIQIVKNTIPEIEFIMVGDEISGRLKGDSGYKRQLELLIQTLGLEKNIKFLGWKTNQDLWNEYSKSDLFLLASTYENFGLPLLEAASFGLPIISTDIGVAKDLIGENQGGIIISKLDANEFAQAIISLLTNDLKYNSCSKFITTQSSNFTINSIVKQYEELYKMCKK